MISFLYGIGVLVVCLCHALPLAAELQKEKEVGEVDASAPAFFKHADHGNRFFDSQYVDSCFEVFAGTHGVYIMVELLDGAKLQCAVKNAEQYGIIGEKFLCIFAVAFGNTADEVLGSFCHCFVFFDLISHI